VQVLVRAQQEQAQEQQEQAQVVEHILALAQGLLAQD
jgi:hypothetical protein